MALVGYSGTSPILGNNFLTRNKSLIAVQVVFIPQQLALVPHHVTFPAP